MPKALYEPCLPTRGKEVPPGADWIHEIKYDGYRLIVRRAGKTVRLFTKNGHDWSKRYPWIMETALKIKQDRFVIDGEAVVLGVNGVSDFDALHSRQHDEEVQLYAFDMLATDGDDIWKLPLSERKSKLDRLSRGVLTASLSRRSNPVHSTRACSRRPARWGWRAWCRSAWTVLTVPAPSGAGSR
jgi:bifunctional non-homologous end joining protein LigD